MSATAPTQQMIDRVQTLNTKLGVLRAFVETNCPTAIRPEDCIQLEARDFIHVDITGVEEQIARLEQKMTDLDEIHTTIDHTYNRIDNKQTGAGWCCIS